MRAFHLSLALPFLAATIALSPIGSGAGHAQQPRAADEFIIPPGPALSRGEMFHSLAGFRIPAGGLNAGIVCKISPADTRITDCVADDNTPAQAVPAVRRRLKSVLNVSLRAAPAIGRTSIFLNPSDYPDLTAEMAIKAKALKLKNNWEGWAVQPTASPQTPASDIDRRYPERALRLEREARVSAICQIQTDGSLACPLVASSTPNFGFEIAGLWVLEIFRAKPRLPGGGRSAGAWVRLAIDFNIP